MTTNEQQDDKSRLMKRSGSSEVYDIGAASRLTRQKSRSRDRRESRMLLVDGQLLWSDDPAFMSIEKRHSSTGFTLGSSMDLSGFAGGTSLDSSGAGSEEAITYKIKWCRDNIANLKRQTWPMEKKLQVLKASKLFIKQHQGELKQSKQASDVLAQTGDMLDRYWRHFKRELANFLVIITPWEMRIKRIESHFGSVVASYFTFLRWIFWLNLANSLVLCSFVMVPELIENVPDLTGMRKGELGMSKAEGGGIVAPASDQDFNPTLGEIWEFEGFLKSSPIFYGYYGNVEISKSGFWRNPLAYLLSAMFTYLLCFICISRKLSQNNRLNRVGGKDDVYTFCWTVFVGWDFMIGNSETAYNKTSSLVMNLKEGILEEKEQTRDRNWRLIMRRVLANVLTMMLIVASAYVVTLAVQRSENLPEDASLLQKNELQLVMSGIQFMFPPLFDVIGIMEEYHPRKALNWQLGRILFLDFLNFYTLMFSLFGTVGQMSNQLSEVSGNITLFRQNQTYYQNLFTTTTTTTTTSTTTTTTSTVTPMVDNNSTISFTINATLVIDSNSTAGLPENTTVAPDNSTTTLMVTALTNNFTFSTTVAAIEITTPSFIDKPLTSSQEAKPPESSTVDLNASTFNDISSTTSENELVSPTGAPDEDYLDVGELVKNALGQKSSGEATTLKPQRRFKRQDSTGLPPVAMIPTLRDPYKHIGGGTGRAASDQSWTDEQDEPIEGRLDVKPSRRTFPRPAGVARPIGGGLDPKTARPKTNLNNQNNNSDDDQDEDLIGDGLSTLTPYQGATESQPTTLVNNLAPDVTQVATSLTETQLPSQDQSRGSAGLEIETITGLPINEAAATTTTDFNMPTVGSELLSNLTAGKTGSAVVSLPALPINNLTNVSLVLINGSIPATSLVNNSSTTEGLAHSDCVEIREFKHQEILGLNSTLRDKLKSLCWETMFGQEMVKIVVMDLVMTVISGVGFDFLRALFVRYCNRFFFWDLERGLPGYQDFKIAENVLHLVNNQSTVWMGMFFAPGLPAINTVKLAVLMYVRSWAVMTCNIPHETVFKVSKSNNFYYLILLLNLLICVMPVAYAVTWIRPSWHCGPFGGECRMYLVVTKLVKTLLPPEVNQVLKYLTSPGVVIPMIILFILIIYYLASTLSMNKEANKELKAQLKKDKDQEAAVPEITSTAVQDSEPIAGATSNLAAPASSSDVPTGIVGGGGGAGLELPGKLAAGKDNMGPHSAGASGGKSLLLPPSPNV